MDSPAMGLTLSVSRPGVYGRNGRFRLSGNDRRFLRNQSGRVFLRGSKEGGHSLPRDAEKLRDLCHRQTLGIEGSSLGPPEATTGIRYLAEGGGHDLHDQGTGLKRDYVPVREALG